MPHASSTRWALGLALSATGTALCLSVLAGWQRGGWWAERLVWVAIGVVLVLSSHLLPALSRTAPVVMRCMAGVLWAACMAAACYGHATFFLLAQQHAGERRAASAFPIVTATQPSGRSLTTIMGERAVVTRQLALATAQHCRRDCSALQVGRATQGAKLDALNAEADEARRRLVADDRNIARRETLLADPVTTRLAFALGSTVTRVDLFSGLTFAIVLEGVACLLWTIALQSRTEAAVMQAGIDPVTTSQPSVIPSHVSVTEPVSSPTPHTEPENEVARLAREVAAGKVRPTVADIRRHLGCSQAKAATLRRQLTSLP